MKTRKNQPLGNIISDHITITQCRSCELLENAHHFDRGESGFAPLIARLAAGAVEHCSIDEQVSTPNNTGTPLSRPARMRSAGHRMIDVLVMARLSLDDRPEAKTAAYFFDFASRSATIGNSNEPGTQTTVSRLSS